MNTEPHKENKAHHGEPAVTIHVLHAGITGCGIRCPDLPNEGHLWVRLEDWDDFVKKGLSYPTLVCMDCHAAVCTGQTKKSGLDMTKYVEPGSYMRDVIPTVTATHGPTGKQLIIRPTAGQEELPTDWLDHVHEAFIDVEKWGLSATSLVLPWAWRDRWIARLWEDTGVYPERYRGVEVSFAMIDKPIATVAMPNPWSKT